MAKWNAVAYWKEIAEEERLTVIEYRRSSHNWQKLYKKAEKELREACQQIADLIQEIEERKSCMGMTLEEYDALMVECQKDWEEEEQTKEEIAILLEQGEILAHNERLLDEAEVTG